MAKTIGTRRVRTSTLWLLTVLAASASPMAQVGQKATEAKPAIRTVSTRPDRVSGGEVLVELSGVQAGTAAAVSLNGQDISATFKPGSRPGTLLGLVSGLSIGKNTIATGPRLGNLKLQVTNYPSSGPITSGPHVKPFICETHKFKLDDGSTFTAEAITNDPSCAAATKMTYLYMPAGGKALIPLVSPSSLPADVATTTSLTGATVKFVVRVETSVINRGIYQSAILHDPTTDPDPTPFTPPAGWNRRLIAVEGFGCTGGWYRQGDRIGNITTDGMPFLLLQLARLREGYALFSNTLQHPSNNCNAVLAGETAMMSKEHFIETYGEPRLTVSAGASGGSYGSFQLADAFPGLFDGVLIARTFTDPMSVTLSGYDARLLLHYLATANPGLTKEQIAEISGYKPSGPDGLLAMVDAARQSGRGDPVPGRTAPGIAKYASASFNQSVPAALRYDPTTNLHGARGNVYDAAKNIYGVDPRTGFALRTFDNVGVQYGLAALNAGAITPQQFLDLNDVIGGLDQDANHVPRRSVGDRGAIQRAYQSGLQFTGGGGLRTIPVVNVTGLYDEDKGYHYLWFHFAVRDRMQRTNGHADNHVSWRGQTDMVPFDPTWQMFIDWVDATKHDQTPGSAREKVTRNKPKTAVDGCWKSPTEFLAEPATLSRTPDTACNALVPGWTFPRYVAGGPIAADILKCELRPLDRKAYKTSFTDDEYNRLRQLFPGGVCDWSKKGVGQADLVPWASFGPAPENLVFDVSKASTN